MSYIFLFLISILNSLTFSVTLAAIFFFLKLILLQGKGDILSMREKTYAFQKKNSAMNVWKYFLELYDYVVENNGP